MSVLRRFFVSFLFAALFIPALSAAATLSAPSG